jgi:hypothetical protein
MSIKAGARVEVGGSPTASQTGSGKRGTVAATYECESSVTGVRLRWTCVDVRLDNGSLVTMEPKQLRVVCA